jgi:hypothetical protein
VTTKKMKFITSELRFGDFACFILDVAGGFRYYIVRPVASISGHSDPNHILHTVRISISY